MNREEATRLNIKHYIPEKPCKKGHMSKRLTKSNHCCECLLETGRKNYSKNKEKYKETKKIWVEKNKSKRKEIEKRWRKNNPEKAKAKCLEWKAKNKEYANKKSREWAKNNLERNAAIASKKRASKINRTPKWLTIENLIEIKDFYIASKMFRMYTGSEYHVDHIVPLLGKTVCGLHVPWNLQILDGIENQRKGNRQWPDQPSF